MEREPHIPGRLAEDLRRAYRGNVQVSGEVDERVLAAANVAASKPVARGGALVPHADVIRIGHRRRVPMRWRVVKWVGMAAAVMLALLVPTQLSRPPAVVVAGDFNRDGFVDILDAFALARAHRDGDGTITRAEIEAAAARAVALHRVGGGA